MAKKRGWTDDGLRRAVASSSSNAATLRALGLVPAGGNYAQVQRRIRELAIDTSHFRCQAWNKGLQLPARPSRPLEELLVKGTEVQSYKLKKRLIAAGLKKTACERCGWCERAPDGRIPLELDHINGDKT